MSEKKIFYFYYDLCCQKLAVYPGTSSEEIKSTIRELLEIPNDEKINYLDEEGNPMVISSALPNDIKIYVQKKKTFTEKFIEQNKEKKEDQSNKEINSIEWFWTEEDKSGSKDDKNSYALKNDNKTVTHISFSRSSFCKGSLKMDSGEYYYSIIFEPLQCCVFGTICPSHYTSKNYEDIDYHDFWWLWKDYPDPHENFPGPVINAGFYINMDLKLLIIYDSKKEKEIKRCNFNKEWTSVSPFIQFKHNVSITVGSKAFRGKPSFIKI